MASKVLAFEPKDYVPFPESRPLAVSSPFSLLPVELHQHILSFLNPTDLLVSAEVCRQWRRLALDPVLWRALTISETCDVIEGECLFRSVPLLQSLTVQNVECACNIFQHLLDYCPRLTTLRLRQCYALDCNLVACFQHLVELDLEDCSKLDDRIICLVAFSIPHLKRLNVAYCLKITDNGIMDIAYHFVNLEALNVTGITHITDCAITSLISAQHSSLLQLCLDGERLTDVTYLALSQCTKLTTLEVIFAELMTDEGLMGLMSLKELRHLKIRFAKELTAQGLNMLFESGNLTKLVSLNLDTCNNLQDRAVLVFSQGCPHLQNLALDWCWDVTEVGLESIVKHCRFLEHVSLTGLGLLEGNCFRHIPELLPRLKFLDLQMCGQICDEILQKVVPRMPNLVILDYYGVVVTTEPDIANEQSESGMPGSGDMDSEGAATAKSKAEECS